MKLTANPAWLSLPPNRGKGSGAKFLRIMKLTTIIILAASLHTSAKGVAQQTITFSGKEVSLESVFTAIKKQTNYRFFFNTDMLATASKVTLDVKNAQIEQVMNMALKDQPLTFTIKGRTIFVMKKPEEEKKSTLVERTGDPITVSGRVTDENGEPLVGANVKVKGSSNGITTDNQGRFTLNNVDPNASLEISFVGHETEILSVKGKTVFSVALGQKVGTLDETIVIAYGTTSRRFSTGNVTSVKASDIEKQPINNPLLALQANVPGLFITQSTGVPGGAVKVRIQGQNSIGNGNEPFYVVDGVPYPSQNLSTTSNMNLLGDVGGGGGSTLAFLNPADIESIEVLKDADATAIYGSRAANGAILITTKKGKIGQTKVDFNISYGWGKITRRLNLLNSQQYVEIRKEALMNSNSSPSAASDYDIMNLYGWDTTRSTDWQKELTGSTAKYTNVQSSISGGTTNLQYLIGTTYRKETSVFPGEFANKNGSFYFNINSLSINKRFKMQLSGNYLLNDNRLPSTDLYVTALQLPPTAPTLYNSDGTINWAVNSSGTSTWVNPLQNVLRYYENKTNNLIGNAVLSYRFLKHFDVSASLGYNKIETNTFNASPLAAVAPERLLTSLRRAVYAFNTMNSWIVEPQLKYENKLGSNSIDILIGATIQQNNSNGIVLEGTGYNDDAVIKDIKSASSIIANSSVISKYKYNAGFIRFNYSIYDKYIINLTARRDGSSRFALDNKFNNFGALGVAWLFSQEKFISNKIPVLSFGKLRASYGITGSDQIGDYSFLSLYTPSSGISIPYQGITNLQPVSLSNSHLQWEETRKLNVGLDVGLFRDKLLFVINYAYNRSSNQLLSYSLPITTGFSGINRNFPATLQNTSLELVLSYTSKVLEDLKWNSSFNLTIPKNELASFPDLDKSSYANLLVIGKPVNVAKRFKYLEVDPVTGLYMVADKDGNPTTNPNFTTDRTVFINTLPKFYGGWQNNFTYKGIQLSILFQFVKQIGSVYYFGASQYPGFRRLNQPSAVLDRWQKNGDIAPIQKYGSAGATTYSNLQNSDAIFDDASYIRVKNLSLSYLLPDKLLRSVRIQSSRIYIQCQNAFTITSYKGIDPENQGVGTLPPLRFLTCGLQVSL